MFWLSFLLWYKETMNEEALPQKGLKYEFCICDDAGDRRKEK